MGTSHAPAARRQAARREGCRVQGVHLEHRICSRRGIVHGYVQNLLLRVKNRRAHAPLRLGGEGIAVRTVASTFLGNARSRALASLPGPTVFARARSVLLRDINHRCVQCSESAGRCRSWGPRERVGQRATREGGGNCFMGAVYSSPGRGRAPC